MAQAITKLMKQARKMQSQMMRAQEELAQQKVEGTAGGGMVTVTLTGAGDIDTVRLRKEAVDPNDVEMLEDMILAAFRNAQEKVKEISNAALGGVTGGLNLPGLM